MKNRIDRVNSLIKEKIADILLREVSIKDVLITVQNVDTTRDLKYAKIQVSIMPFEKSKEVLEILKKQTPKIQRQLNEIIKIKFIPKIEFEIDKSGEKVNRVEEILKGLNR